MGWRDLVATDDEKCTLPWVGGRSLHAADRKFKLRRRPPEHGWYIFKIEGNVASAPAQAEPEPELLKHTVVGYLVGDRIVPDDTRIDPDPAKIVLHSERVFMLPEGLERFARVRAGRIYPEGPLIFKEEEFPLGPEDEVMRAYEDEEDAVHTLPGVVPALDAAFRMETFQRAEAERRRLEIARRRAEEEERREKERRRQELLEKLGDGEKRRALARVDFKEAAKAALEVGGACYLDHRRGGRRGEWIVNYRVGGQRLQCVCDTNLQIVDAGVCLTDHTTGEKGDTYFTLESLPPVIREAIEEDKLVVWRHV